MLNSEESVVWLDDALGQTVCSLPAVAKLCETRKVVVVTNFPEVFLNQPNVYKIYSIGHPYLWDDIVKNRRLISPRVLESSSFYKDKKHFVEVYNQTINGSLRYERPTIHLTQQEINKGNRFIEQLRVAYKKPIVLIQPTASTNAISGGDAEASNPQWFDGTHRSLFREVAIAIMDKIDAVFVVFSAHEIPGANKAVRPDVRTTSLRDWFAITKSVDAVVTVDSAMVHIAHAVGQDNVLVLMGATCESNSLHPGQKFFKKDGWPKTYQPFGIRGFMDGDDNILATRFSQSEVEVIAQKVTEMIKK